jgi:site-specific DNA-methyltransferase (adenine-specific)
MLIKASTKKNDLVKILFGGSGSEIVLCKELGRNFISSELHKPYFDMIINRLNNNGIIKEDYKLKFKNKNLNCNAQPMLFEPNETRFKYKFCEN